MSLARDLHDGIVQFLAGSTYRVEAISRSVGDRSEAAASLRDLKELMLLEQEDLRTSIAALRKDAIHFNDVIAEARALCGRLSRHWQVECKFEGAAADLMISARLHLDILQIIGEAAANAVRHSAAKNLEISVDRAGAMLAIKVVNDGAGADPGAGPWSIRERVQDSGGTVSMTSGSQGTILVAQIPLAEGMRA
jgi:signal transduction histidine kinase